VRTKEQEQIAGRFLLEVEAAVIDHNRKAISAKLSVVTRAQFERLAASVAQIRADYLAAAFDCDWSTETCLEASGIQEKRRRYEEAVAAFEALERAVKRGYVQVRPV